MLVVNQDIPGSIPVLWNWCSEAVGASNFEILAEESDTNGSNSITLRLEQLLVFQF